jgi:hypothetical protein
MIPIREQAKATDEIDFQAMTRAAAATRAGAARATVTAGLVRVLGDSI